MFVRIVQSSSDAPSEQPLIPQVPGEDFIKGIEGVLPIGADTSLGLLASSKQSDESSGRSRRQGSRRLAGGTLHLELVTLEKVGDVGVQLY